MYTANFRDIVKNASEQKDFEENHFVKAFSAVSECKRDIARLAHQFHTIFPDKFGKVIVVTVSDFDNKDGDILYISPSSLLALRNSFGRIREELKNIRAIRKVFEESCDFFQKKGKYVDTGSKIASAVITHNHSNFFNKVIAIKEGLASGFSSCIEEYTEGDFLKDNFVHECGHALVDNGRPLYDNLYIEHLAECAADALKIIEHYAEKGHNDWYHNANSNANSIVLGFSPIHYRNTITHAVKNLAACCDLSKLDIEQKIQLAGYVAREYAFYSGDLASIMEVFKPVADDYRFHKHFMREHVVLCANAMLENTNNHDAYRAGKIFLSSDFMKEYISQYFAEGPVWQELSVKMKEFEESSGIELNPAIAHDNKSDYSFINCMKEKFLVLCEKEHVLKLKQPQP